MTIKSNNKDFHKEAVEQVKMCGQSIIDNAESIVGTEKFMTGFDVTIHINWDEVPYINVCRDFLPEKLVEME